MMIQDDYDDEDQLGYEDEEPQGPSRSELKRQAQDRQALVARVLELSPKEWEKLGFGETERKSLLEGKKIKASGARNRQVKYLARILDDDALEAAAAFMDNRHSQQLEANRLFHSLEMWRDRLIAEGPEAMGALLEKHPDLDRQQLRQLTLTAQREQETGKPPGAAKKLFRFLREQTGH